MHFRRALTVGLLVIAACLSFGQVNRVDQPLPPFEIPEWREVERTGSTVEYSVTLPSAFKTSYEVNNLVPLRVLIPADKEGPVPVVIVLHYWGARDLRVERGLAAELNRRGVAAILPALPYHLGRTPPGFDSGDLAVQPDPQAMIANMVQSVWDVRRIVDFIGSRPEFSKVGIAGTSLGAVVSALAYAVEPRIELGSFALGGADIAHIIWNSSRVVRQRDQLRRAGYTEERLRQAIKEIEPLEYLGRREGGGAFVVGARYDTVVPRSSTEALIRALPSAKTLFVDTGHYGGIFVQRRILREIAIYFAAAFGGAEYKPPTRIYAPTVRIGGLASTTDGFDLAAGIDLFKFDPIGRSFASFLITPRGPQAFVGFKIDSRISFGVVGTRTKVGAGLFWSTVL